MNEEQDNYASLISDLQREASSRLRLARNGNSAVADAIMFYIQKGDQAGLSPEELVDFFAVSTPNVLEDAGYVGDAGDDVVALFDKLHSDFQNSKR